MHHMIIYGDSLTRHHDAHLSFPTQTVLAGNEHKNEKLSALRGYHQEENQHPLMVSTCAPKGYVEP